MSVVEFRFVSIFIMVSVTHTQTQTPVSHEERIPFYSRIRMQNAVPLKINVRARVHVYCLVATLESKSIH